MSCPRCEHLHCVKNGKVEGKQRYRCKSCKFQFTRLTPRGHPLWLRALAVFLYCHGLSMNAIAKMFSVSTPTILRWIRKFGVQHAQPPEPEAGTAVVLELDEMWHYLKKKRKLWIWKALRRDTGELIAWQCGDRDKTTLKKLLSKLSTWQVKLYYTDDWHPYKAVIPPNLLVQSKKETHRIERNNNIMRHWFGRFKRKSIIVSKSIQMVDLTIALFARFRVNGSIFDIFEKIPDFQISLVR